MVRTTDHQNLFRASRRAPAVIAGLAWPAARRRNQANREASMSSHTVADSAGWDIGWGIADQLAERLPLGVMQDCLQLRLSSPEPRRSHARPGS